MEEIEMDKKNILMVVGSFRKNSFNQTLQIILQKH